MKQQFLKQVISATTATYKQYTAYVTLCGDNTLWLKYSNNAGGDIAFPTVWESIDHKLPFIKSVSVALWDERLTITASCGNSAIWTKTLNLALGGKSEWVNINKEPEMPDDTSS